MEELASSPPDGYERQEVSKMKLECLKVSAQMTVSYADKNEVLEFAKTLSQWVFDPFSDAMDWETKK